MTAPVNYSTPLTKRQRLELLRAQLEVERQSFISHWRDLGDFILPRRPRFTVSDTNKGDRRTRNIIDSTATMAAGTLRSGMMSGVTSPARPWFRLAVPDRDLAEYGPVKDWLGDVSKRMASIFLRSNLYNVLPIVYGDMGVFGTSAMFVAEDPETVIRCVDFPVGSYALATDSKLRVRVFVREFRMTVRQLVEQFGQDKVSRNVRDLWSRAQFDQWVDVVHVIHPNPDADPTKLQARYKPFYECYYEKGSNDPNPEQFLAESGYTEFPLLAPRWEVTGEDVYGTNSPGMTALGDIKQLQLMEKRAAQALDKMVNPPMVAQPSMKQSALSILAGGVSYVADPEGKGFRPAHEVSLRLDFLEQKANEVRYRIQRCFFEDLFLMLAQLDRKEITATEILERREEKMLALGPVLERLNQDLLDPLIDRTFAIMVRQGLVPEPPEELQGQPLKVEYESVLAQAQKAAGLAGLERTATFAATLAKEIGDPSIMDKIDTDQLLDEYGDMTGTPSRVIRSDEQVAQIRAERAKAQQAAQQAATLKDAAQGAKTLSETDTQGPNALTDLLGGMAGGMGGGMVQ